MQKQLETTHNLSTLASTGGIKVCVNCRPVSGDSLSCQQAARSSLHDQGPAIQM
jgi:hypothetical protein